MSAYTQLAKWDQETKIPEMNLEQIKTMMCPISGGDHLKCIDCKSLKTCQAGQRVMVLLEEETKCTNVGGVRREKARKMAVKAALSKDPVHWIMENTGCNIKAARQKLLNWSRWFPDVGFPEKKKKMPEKKGLSRDEKQRLNLIEAIESGDPLKWYMRNQNSPRKRTMEVIEKGLNKFPDIREMYDKAGWGHEEVKADQDEISIEEFLNDVEQETADNAAETAVEQPPENKEEEIPVEEEKPVEAAKKAAFGNTVLNIELENKYNQLNAEKEKVLAEIEKLKERMQWLEEQQDAIAKVRNLFDPNTAIGRSLITE